MREKSVQMSSLCPVSTQKSDGSLVGGFASLLKLQMNRNLQSPRRSVTASEMLEWAIPPQLGPWGWIGSQSTLLHCEPQKLH